MDEHLVEIARRFHAAFVSYQLGTAVSTELRNFANEQPGEFWIDLARRATEEWKAAADRR